MSDIKNDLLKNEDKIKKNGNSQDNTDNNGGLWADITGKTAKGQSESPDIKIGLGRIIVGTIVISIIIVTSFVICWYLSCVSDNRWVNFSAMLGATVIFTIATLIMLGEIFGPKSYFKPSMIWVFFLYCSIAVLMQFSHDRVNFGSNGESLKWYCLIDGKPVLIDKALNQVKFTADSVEYFIHPTYGDTCWRLTPQIKRLMDHPNASSVNTGSSLADSILILAPRNEAYDFILDSGKTTKMLAFPPVHLKMVMSSIVGSFTTLVDTDNDWIIDREVPSDSLYTFMGKYETVRFKLKALTRDTLSVLVTK